MHNNCAQGGGYSHNNMPNKKACNFNDETSGYTYYTVVGPSSNQPGGVNVFTRRLGAIRQGEHQPGDLVGHRYEGGRRSGERG
jgi:hypothetical protein